MTELNRVIHQENRLRIMALLASSEVGDRAEFGYLRTELGLSDGNLSVHLSKLEEAGLVYLEKEFAGRKPKTWIRISDEGRRSFRAYIDELEKIIRNRKP